MRPSLCSFVPNQAPPLMHLLLEGLCPCTGLISAGDVPQRNNCSWRSPDVTIGKRLDHILFPSRWRSSAQRIRVVTSVIPTDQRMVVFDFLRKFQAKPRNPNPYKGPALPKVDPPYFRPLSDDPALHTLFGAAFDAAIPTQRQLGVESKIPPPSRFMKVGTTTKSAKKMMTARCASTGSR